MLSELALPKFVAKINILLIRSVVNMSKNLKEMSSNVEIWVLKKGDYFSPTDVYTSCIPAYIGLM